MRWGTVFVSSQGSVDTTVRYGLGRQTWPTRMARSLRPGERLRAIRLRHTSSMAGHADDLTRCACSEAEPSFILAAMKLLVAVALLTAACGSKSPSTTTMPTSGEGSAAVTLPDVPFESLDHE